MLIHHEVARGSHFAAQALGFGRIFHCQERDFVKCGIIGTVRLMGTKRALIDYKASFFAQLHRFEQNIFVFILLPFN